MKTDTDTLLKIQATNVQESMTIDNTMSHCIPRKINKSYKLKMDQLTKDRLKTSDLYLRTSRRYMAKMNRYAKYLQKRIGMQLDEVEKYSNFCLLNNNIDICVAPYGRNFRGSGPGSVLVGVRRGKRVSLREEKCL